MATSRLKIYNGALLICGQRSIANLSVNEEGRRLLDEVWNDGGVRYCLERGQWRFAMRTSRFSYDTGVTPEFGYRRAFAKPSDWVATSAIGQDEYFRSPLMRCSDEAGFWFADLDEIFVRYVSDDDDFGNNLSLWPASFTEYVKHYFASRIIYKVSASETMKEALLKPRSGLLSQALLTAKNHDAMGETTKMPPQGGWSKARQGGGGGGPLRDGGNGGSLIG